MKFFKKSTIKKLGDEKKQQRELRSLDKKREELNIKFDTAPSGSVEKGEYLKEFIRLTEERLKIKSSFRDRQGLRMIKTMYKTGLKFGKWKKPQEIGD